MKIKYKCLEEAVAAIPIELIGSSDPIQQTTIKHLANIAIHELNLFNEGEETDIKDISGYIKVKQFLDNCLRSIS